MEPLMGEHVVVVRDVREIDIHGARFLDIAYALEGSDEVLTCRIGPESVEGGAHPGDRVRMQFVMRQPVRVRPA